jgi:hypothetical protein
MMKFSFKEDGFLKWLHILMMIDDTVLLATSKEKLVAKIMVMNQYCVEYGMVVNENLFFS